MKIPHKNMSSSQWQPMIFHQDKYGNTDIFQYFTETDMNVNNALMQCKTLLELQWNQQQGHMQYHSKPVTKNSKLKTLLSVQWPLSFCFGTISVFCNSHLNLYPCWYVTISVLKCTNTNSVLWTGKERCRKNTNLVHNLQRLKHCQHQTKCVS